MDRADLTSYCTAREVLGDEFQASKYNMDQTQAALSTPLVLGEPAWIVAFSAFNALNAVSFRLEVELEFDAKFFDLTSA